MNKKVEDSHKEKAKSAPVKSGAKGGSTGEPAKGERIAKVMARGGLCSRRDAERWIAEGRVQVNGKILETAACVVTEKDKIVVDGKTLQGKEPTRLWCYYKPDNLVTSHNDEKGRMTVFDALPSDMPRVISIGRLDLTTEGLLLLTNDGELSRFLEHPSTGWVRRYRVRAFGEITQKELDGLQKGVTVDGISYGPIEATFEKQQGSNVWLNMALKEGKNREIRNVLEHLGLSVNRLIRLSYGPFQLGTMKENEVREITQKVLKEQISNFFVKK